MTDAYTDELFQAEPANRVIFQYSRLLVDVERFSVDEDEPMAKVGMGMIYTRTAFGGPLKRELSENEKRELRKLYSTHHDALDAAVDKDLSQFGHALIVDCHSFPSRPLPCDMSQKILRPDFCIGTDDFHTPSPIVKALSDHLNLNGYTVAVNEPYSGTIVPLSHYRKSPEVMSVMIEINRSLYMDEETGEKNYQFDQIRNLVGQLLNVLKQEPTINSPT